jgi:CitMHS family citrate-Mg2+:H+ or citrate-Ca2+:H+ symporter
MLAWLGFGMVTTFMTLIMTRRMSPLVALISVPIVFALLGGFDGAELGTMMLSGLRTLAPTGVMLMFAILYFGLMIDTGLFDPLIRAILRVVHGDPVKIVVGTALLATLVSLDGDGSTTYMITVAAMLPLYRRLQLDPLNLTCVTILASGVMNLTPWGGPLARAASALHVEPADVFVPMLPAMAVGIAAVFGLAWLLGRREKGSRSPLSPVEIARASLIGQPVHLLSPLVPSTYLLVGLAGVEFGDHQRFTLKWAVVVCLVMLLASLACAVFPLLSR